MRKGLFYFYLLFVLFFLSGCFFKSLFDFGPKIDLNTNLWQIASFKLGDTMYKPEDYEQIPQIRFDTKELKLYGESGCNMFFASYSWINDEKIEMRHSGMTRKICQSADLMKFEEKLLEEFDGDFKVIKNKNQMILKKENLEILLVPMDPSIRDHRENSDQNPSLFQDNFQSSAK